MRNWENQLRIRVRRPGKVLGMKIYQQKAGEVVAVMLAVQARRREDEGVWGASDLKIWDYVVKSTDDQ